ncbi:putative uncharacterized protein ENSP00000383309 [Rhipicephalus sanguineus]|uniref:putative uncharacterized protein ENSP00000383309 n=1 Tax=Rhipicephalus sanguineus TaxID=34632 RepID=UPI001894CE44|nr:putative uncharacterized protein ENSP00000383309 [Rhipicephalus sanguineus]
MTTSPASSRGSSKTRTSPGSRPNRATKVNEAETTKRTLRPRLGSGRRRRRSRQRRHRRSSRQPLICPEMLGEPLSTSSYRCIQLPPGKTVFSEIAQRSPIFHVYAETTRPDATPGPATPGPATQSPQQSSVPTKASLSMRSPAPADGTTTATAPSSRRPPCGLVPERPATPALYVLRSRSSLSQDSNVKCGIREVSCGLERGPVFTPIQPSAFSTTVRRAITPARIHRPPRADRHHSTRRTASLTPMTPPRSAHTSPTSRAPSREGLINEGYCSD